MTGELSITWKHHNLSRPKLAFGHLVYFTGILSNVAYVTNLYQYHSRHHRRGSRVAGSIV